MVRKVARMEMRRASPAVGGPPREGGCSSHEYKIAFDRRAETLRTRHWSVGFFSEPRLHWARWIVYNVYRACDDPLPSPSIHPPIHLSSTSNASMRS